jgi:ribose transport system permease protein
MMSRKGLASYLEFHRRSVAIWGALALLLAVSAVVAPTSVSGSSLSDIAPFAAVLALVALGQVLVVMTGGIDLSVPAVVTLVGTLIVGISQGSDTAAVQAIVVALVVATAVGLVNGGLVVVLGLNPLVVTLAVGSIVSGVTLWYREGVAQEASVPGAVANFGTHRFLGLNVLVWLALLLGIVLTVVVTRTATGRRFQAAGTNPRAAWIAGVPVTRYTIVAYASAGLIYGLADALLAAFLRNPNLDVGTPYLLAPIAAVVLGGAALSGGIASIPATIASSR